MAWLREDDGDRLLAAVNFATVPAPLALRGERRGRAPLVVSTDPSRSDDYVDLDAFTLRPSEGVLLKA
jgi:alpha-glucosidase